MTKELSKYDQLCVKHKQTNKQTKQTIAKDFSFGFWQPDSMWGKNLTTILLIALLVIGTHILSVAVYC